MNANDMKNIEKGLLQNAEQERDKEKQRKKGQAHMKWLADQHLRALRDICNGYDKEEAELICYVFAAKWPELMHDALSDRHSAMKSYISSMEQLHSGYYREEA